MRYQTVWCWLWCGVLVLCLVVWLPLSPAYAASIDPYVARYLRVTEPVSLPLDRQGNSRLFSPIELSQGKALFEKTCLNCHVGGTTLPDPTVPLSLTALQGATPPRDTVNSLVAFLRQPMTYDGTEEAILCKRVLESWMSTAEVEAIAGLVLRAAQVAPGWGTETFEN